ncbi:hypothetical protein ACIBBB_09850 [Streptomyces sp. NPDC051217]|uniref:hypothetical protein n=1 Tax=Streptomyces sp. NPDC051217 TaxID=3365644 RepID=UPI0037AF4B75
MYATLVFLVASCGADRPAEREAEVADKPFACIVEQEIEPIAATFEKFGDVASASWCLIGASGDETGRAPGPTDERLVGILTARDGQVVGNALRTQVLGFTEAAPEEIPVEISELLPAGANWVESEKFNADITGSLYDGRFFLDKKTNRVLFDCSNPVKPGSGPPNVVVG